MTRKDYVALSAAMRAARDDIYRKEPEGSTQTDLLDGVSYAAEHIADALAQDNRAFDRARFLRDAGVQS